MEEGEDRVSIRARTCSLGWREAGELLQSVERWRDSWASRQGADVMCGIHRVRRTWRMLHIVHEAGR